MTPVSREISDSIRVARVIGILGLVIIHVPPWRIDLGDPPRAIGAFDLIFLYCQELFGRASVPLLSVISGYLMVHQHEPVADLVILESGIGRASRCAQFGQAAIEPDIRRSRSANLCILLAGDILPCNRVRDSRCLVGIIRTGRDVDDIGQARAHHRDPPKQRRCATFQLNLGRDRPHGVANPAAVHNGGLRLR